jgi:GNAT superfamily N-acetyltransferase
VLSGGEKFRCDLARALAGASAAKDVERAPFAAFACDALVAFDEFTSVVDRNVARIGSAAVAKAVRGGAAACSRFVAVSCHYDIAEWLEPDWVIDMATSLCIRRRLRRPEIPLRIYRSDPSVWRLFKRHHYLSGQLNAAARCYLAWWKDEPVTFCATLPVWGRPNHYRISRIVTLPDYQGIGIGMRVAEAVAAIHVREGLRFSITASHPAVIAHCKKSDKWRTANVMKLGSRQSQGRATVSFEFQKGVRDEAIF